jgi:hypothetical protein
MQQPAIYRSFEECTVQLFVGEVKWHVYPRSKRWRDCVNVKGACINGAIKERRFFDIASLHDQVTLSPQAKTIASLAAKGISVEVVSFASMGLPPPPSQGGQPAALSYFEKISAAQGTTPHDANGNPDGQISQTGLEQVVQQFGSTKAQADQLFAALDTNGNSSLSNAEVLSGLAATSTDPNSAVSQSLLKLMDQNGDNSVSQDEFLALETALVEAEKAPQSTSQSS